MSRKVYKALRTLQESLRKNEPRVLRQFEKAGVEPDPSIVYSFALYYDTLKRLAKE
jgi:hypothetical protein